ncbi:MAG: flavodoxin domain-containing protein [Anaerolineales bacterium]|jgi:flavodoxin
MRVLVVYDSVFGNTELVAQAVGKALGSPVDVAVVRVNDVKLEQLAGLQLLIVGSPTRGFRPTEAIADFLKRIPADGIRGVPVAAFDTRLSTSDIESSALRLLVKTGGYAAKPIADRLKKKGGEVIIPPEGFLVSGEKGPLKEGELERAALWAKRITESRDFGSRHS